MQVYIGIDWSEKKHDAIFLNEAGERLAYVSFAHTAPGLEKFDNQRRQVGLEVSDCIVGLETAHNMLLDFLWARNYAQVYVVPPHVVHSSRKRYRHSGARNDEYDAYVIADYLRTDHQRLRPWRPDSRLTRQMGAQVRLYFHLAQDILRLSNRLRAVLLRYYPTALHLFSEVDTQIGLAFICAYPTPQEARQLSYEAFKTFACQHRYTIEKRILAKYAILQERQPEASPDAVQAYRNQAIMLAESLLHTVRNRSATKGELKRLFAQHPDYEIFVSLPGIGDILGPGLIAKFGDDRLRFSSPATLQALAGTCPITDQSGQHKRILFRKACDREFRYICQQWALNSLKTSVWANTYFHELSSRGLSTNHAYRCLANRWLAIAWKCWQTNQPYDETYHLQHRLQRRKTK